MSRNKLTKKPAKQDLTPLEKLKKLQDLMNGFGAICGVDCLRGDYKLNAKTKATIVAIITYITFTFYTLFFFRGHIFKQLQTLCVYGLIVAVNLIDLNHNTLKRYFFFAYHCRALRS